MMFAVLSSNGNQYKVEPNKEYKIESIEGKSGDKITFSEVLLVSDKKTIIGTPHVSGASVEAEIVKQGDTSPKINVFKFRAKKRYKRTLGHKQKITIIKVIKISSANEK